MQINRRREKRLQASKSNQRLKMLSYLTMLSVFLEKNSTRMKKSAEFINEDEDDDDDDIDESSMDVADTIEVRTTPLESKLEQV